MNEPIDKDLFRRYLDGQCTAGEEDLVQKWLLSDDHGEIARHWMEEHWRDVPEASLDAGQEARLVEALRGKGYPVSRRARRADFTTYFLRAAAAILVVVLALGAIRYLSTNLAVVPETSAWISVENPSSGHSPLTPVTLPDGTRVWLNAGSQLRYPARFEPGTRDVYLTGEAFFDVTESPSRTFIVHTRDIRIKVLGTAFNVKSYPDETTTETVLLRGSVLVEKPSLLGREQVTLKPNERVVFSRRQNEISKTAVDANRFIGWREGRLTFDNEPMSSVIRVLERWYGIDIRLTEKNNISCRLTAEIQHETLEETLRLLAESTGVTYTVNGSEVILDGAICE